MFYRVRNLSLFLVLLLGIFSMWAATINVPADYTTIQAAINAATAGDEIIVADGTYIENVVINKSVTLNGANADTPFGSRSPASVIAPASGLPVSIVANNVTLNGFEITGPGYQYGINITGSYSNINIKYNNIHHIGTTITNTNVHALVYHVANAVAPQNLSITDNRFQYVSSSLLTGYSAAAIGILHSASTGTLTGLNILRNTISDVEVNIGAWPTGKLAYGIVLNTGGGSSYLTTTGKLVNVAVEYNQISNIKGFIATGIGMEGNTENAVVRYNEVSNLTAYKLADRAGGGYDMNALKFENNRYVGSVTVAGNVLRADTFVYNGTPGLGYAVSNYVPTTVGTLNMTGNWYGTTVLAEIMDNDALTGKLFAKAGCAMNFLPYSTSDDPLNTLGMGPVVNTTQNTSYITIQAAINAATAGDEIQVGPGTYTGNVVITKSLTLISTDGAATTILDGLASDPGLGTIHINTGVNNLTIGTTNHGFHVKGIDGPAGNEKAAIYFQGAQNNVLVQGNIIEARGDAGIMGEYNAANTNFTIDNNIITGQTFLGANPAGVGFLAQYSLLNVPRQLVVFGGGAGTSNTQNFTFTNNVLSGIAGGMSITNDSGAPIAPTPQGNTLMTLEIAGTCIVSNNTFSGITTRYAEALRMRASGAYTFSGNVFNGTYPVIATAATSTPAIGIARISDLLATSTFTKYAVVRSGGALAVATIYPTINSAIAAATAGQEVFVSAGTFTEDVLINKPLTLTGANADIPYGPGRGAESIIQPASNGVTAISLGTGVGPNNVTINGFEITAPTSNSAIWCGDTGPSYLTIKYNYIHHVGNLRGSLNVYAINYRCANTDQTDINISYNYIEHVLNDTAIAEKSSAAIWIGQSPATGVYSNVLIEYNTIKNVHSYNGSLFGADALNTSGINIGCGWKSTGYLDSPIIRYNTITDLNGYAVYGIALQGNTPGAQIYGNTFNNLLPLSVPEYAAAVCVFYNDGYGTNNGTGITAYNNSFTSTHYGIYNATTNQINGLSNWWGHASGPQHPVTNSSGQGAIVSDYVTYDPWFANTEMTVIGSNKPVKNVTQGLFYDTIQPAINAAAVGDVITVAAGTYNETVNVNKRLTLTGAGSGVTTINSTGVVLTVSPGTGASERSVVSGFKLIGGTTGIGVGSYTTITDIVADGNVNHGIKLSSPTDLVITNCSFINSPGVGLKLASTAPASYITISGSHFDNNYQGWYSDTNKTSLPILDHVTITNTTFNNNTIKGFYTERLSNALFDGVTVDGSGCLGTYAFGAGFDLNTKYTAFSNITIQNSSFLNCGVGSTNGVGLTIKARDDGDYASPPATLSNVIIDNVTFTGNKTGLVFGEPGKDNAGPTAVVVKNCTFNNLEMAINNFCLANVDALTNNTFTGTTNDFEVEEVIYHKVDNPVKGLVKWVEDSIYVPVTQTIQSAVNAATPEDVIVIEGGTYTENLLLNKKVTLQPANREPIILDGGGTGSVITITADGVEVTGMTIQNSGTGQTDAGILINQASNCNIHGNTITDNANGILTILGGLNTIATNTVTNNDYYGIAFVGASGNTIELNNVSGNGLDAIAMDNANALGAPTVVSSANLVKTNTISSNRDGVFIGEGCNGNSVTDNNTITAASTGISIWRPSSQVITGNTISSCATGIRLLGSSNNVITGNNLTGNQIGMLVDASWQLGVWYPSLNNDIQNNRFIANTLYAIDALDTEYGQQPAIVAERNYWGSPSGPATGAQGNIVANVDNDPWWINYGLTILSTDVTLSLSTPEHLVKDLETQPFAVTLAQVEDLRGFNVQIKVPKIDYAIPTNIAIGPSFAAGDNTLFTIDSSDNDYWMIDVTGSYDGAASLDGPNLVLFTFDLTTLEDASNLTGSQIELPLAQVLMYDEMNQYIPCAGTTGEVVIIDSGEPELEHDNATTYPSGMLLTVDAGGSGLLVRPVFELTMTDDYDLSYAQYMIIAEDATVPEAINQFSLAMPAIDGTATTGYTWQLPESVDGLDDGLWTVYFIVVDDAGNFSIYDWDFEIDKTVPATPLWTSCLTTVNGANSVDLVWTGDAAKYDIWVLNYDDLTDAGAYPLYNPAVFGTPAIPAAPNAYNPDPQNGWTRIENDLVGTTYTHIPAVRGYYYYYIFAEDLAGNYSPVSEMRESISYWPGDVNETPDGLVNSDDIVLLGSVWGQTAGISTYDVGPSIGRLRRGRPTPDGRINIEDLMMFSMNYMNTNYTAYPRSTNDSKPDPVRIDIEQEILGNELIVRLILSENNGLVKGLNIPLEIGSGLELQSVTAGTIWGEESVLLHTNEQGKVELSGSNLVDCIAENGLVATLSFKISGQNTELALKHMIARAFDNSDIEIIDNPQDAPSGDDDPEIIIPATSFLGANYPNPFNPTTTIGFGLNESGNVKISVFNSRGQLVRTLVNGTMQAGMHNVVWNGMDDSNRPLGSGIYFIKMQTRNLEQTTRAIMVK